MNNGVKIFLHDLSTQSKAGFFAKYMLPVLILFFALAVIGKLAQMGLTTKSLIANKGQVLSIGIQVEYGHTRSGSYKLYPLKIVLYKEPSSFEGMNKISQFKNLFQEFRLLDNFRPKFFGITDEIHQGDTITVYTRTGWQTFLGWGRKNDIYQIEKNNKVLFPIRDMLDHQNGQMIIFTFFLLGSSAIYMAYRLSRRKKDKEYQVPGPGTSVNS